MLRAWLWTASAATTGRPGPRSGPAKAFGIMLIALGVLGLLTGTDLGGLWFVVLGWFLIQAAQGEMEQAEARQALRGLQVRDVMRTGAVTVSPDRSVAAFLDDAGHAGASPATRWSTTAAWPAWCRCGGGHGACRPAAGPAGGGPDDPGGPGPDGPAGRPGGGHAGGPWRRRSPRGGAGRRRPGRGHADGGGRRAGPGVGAAGRAAAGAGSRFPQGQAHWWRLVVGAIMLVAIGLLYTPPFLVVSPGPTYAVEGDVTVTGRPTTPVTGHYLAATVTLHQRTALGTLIAAVRPDVRSSPRRTCCPRVSRQRSTSASSRAYLDSRRVAAAAAARAVGLPVTISGAGAGDPGRRGRPRRRGPAPGRRDRGRRRPAIRPSSSSSGSSGRTRPAPASTSPSSGAARPCRSRCRARSCPGGGGVGLGIAAETVT